MKKNLPKKLELKKATVLKFYEANKILGGQLLDCEPYTTQADNCSSKPGRDDSCTRCLTNEASCPKASTDCC